MSMKGVILMFGESFPRRRRLHNLSGLPSPRRNGCHRCPSSQGNPKTGRETCSTSTHIVTINLYQKPSALSSKVAGELVTGLLYVDPDPDDLHDHLNTVDAPFNRLSTAELCPGSGALDAINRSHGREAGDHLLRAVAHRIDAAAYAVFGRRAVVVRGAGPEFRVATTAAGAEEAQRFRSAIDERFHRPFVAADAVARVVPTIRSVTPGAGEDENPYEEGLTGRGTAVLSGRPGPPLAAFFFSS